MDVTFRDLTIYRKAKEDPMGKFGNPSCSQPEIDQWFWTGKTLVIFQRDANCIQISFSSGEMPKLNDQEKNGNMA
jgi:hypothetical protein